MTVPIISCPGALSLLITFCESRMSTSMNDDLFKFHLVCRECSSRFRFAAVKTAIVSNAHLLLCFLK